MKKKGMAFVIFCVLLLAGCAAVPSEVKGEIAGYQGAVQKGELRFLPFAEAVAQAGGFDGSTAENNVSIGHLILPDGGKLPVYRVDFSDGNLEEWFTKLQSESLFGFDGTGFVEEYEDDFAAWRKAVPKCFSYHPSSGVAMYNQGEARLKFIDKGGGRWVYESHMVLENPGMFYVVPKDGEGDANEFRNYFVVKRFYGDFSQEREIYAFRDGVECSVAEVSAFAEEVCNTTLRESENNLFEYRVNYVDVRTDGNGEYGYYVSLCRVDAFGNYFDATKIYPYTVKEYMEKTPFIASPISLWIIEKGKIENLERKYMFSLEEAGQIEDIVTLESAIDIVADTLAQGRSYYFDTVELKYMFEITQSDYMDAAREYARADEEEGRYFSWNPQAVYAYGDYEIKAVPYWVFTNVVAGSQNSNCGRIYMVNAMDGSFRAENVNPNGGILIPY